MPAGDRKNKLNYTIIDISTSGRRAALLAGVAFFLFLTYFFVRWSFADMAAMQTDLPEIAELAVRLGPSDPQTHYTAATLYEKTFLPEDFERSLIEYETAVALSPANYLLWMDLGKARERSGDPAGAEKALRHALDLAPNYAAPRWALGNALLRQGRTDEGFEELRAAISANPELAGATVRTGLEIFDGDLSRIRTAIGDFPEVNAALVSQLIEKKRNDEAFRLWRSLPLEQKTGVAKEASDRLLSQLIAEKKYGQAFLVYADMQGNEPKPGQITNGGFEGDIKTQDVPIFEWQLGAGSQPQIALTDGQKHSGSRSIWLIFNSTEAKDFRTISQYVAVEGGKTYQFDAFYRSDLKSAAAFRWEIVNASDGTRLAVTDAVSNSPEWKQLSARFTVPQAAEAVIIRLARDNCTSAICPAAGKLWFDDLSLQQL